MKVKDLIGINPEAEISVVFADGTPFSGKLSYGWDSGDCESVVDAKLTAKEVCIFLGDIDENISEV
jgi:hypothetical protein